MMTRKFAQFLVRNKNGVLITMLLLTGSMAYVAVRYLSLRVILEELLPTDHVNVRLFKKFLDQFGGANNTVVEIRVKEGTIYDPKVLAKIKRVEEDIAFYPDTKRAFVQSIATKKVKAVHGRSGQVVIEPLMWPDVPKTPDEVEEVKANAKELYEGFLVSRDDKAALILADFDPNADFQKLFEHFRKIKGREEDGNTTIHIAGRPVLYGWIYASMPQMIAIFFGSVVLVLAIVYYYFNSVLGMLVPLVKALMTTCWGLGFISLFRYNVDPLMLLLPFFVFATVLSHSVQITSRFYEEYGRLANFDRALEETLVALLRPSFTSIFTDAAGFTVLYLARIPTLQVLAILCTVWLLSITLAVTFSTATFFYVPMPEKLQKRGLGFVERFLGKIDFGRSGKAIIGASLLILLASIYYSTKLVIGDAHPGSPILWPDAPYNRDVGEINRRFDKVGADTLQVFIEGPQQSMKNPAVYHKIEAFERRMVERVPEVGGSQSLVPIIKRINQVLYEGDPSYSYLPSTMQEIGSDLYFFVAKGEPGDFDIYTDSSWQFGNMSLFLKDHKADTINLALREAGAALREIPSIPGIDFKLAGGQIGLVKAINDEVERSNNTILFAIVAVIFVSCAVGYRSVFAGGLLTVMLLISNFLAFAYMGIAKIGLNINTLPVSSIGIGRGVDYGIYTLDRLREEYQHVGNLDEAIRRTLGTCGIAILVTALTMILPLVPWYFISSLRFQAEMGILLAIILFFNALGALVFVPAVVRWIRPKFIMGQKVQGTEETMSLELQPK